MALCGEVEHGLCLLIVTAGSLRSLELEALWDNLLLGELVACDALKGSGEGSDGKDGSS